MQFNFKGMPNRKPSLSMLAIDDEASILLILQHYFKDLFIVKTGNNAKEALSWMLSGNIPDIIIVDINMPEMDGYAFVNQVRSSGFLKHIPVVILSANDKTDDKIRCLEAGADDYIAKPFNPKELGARINGMLRRTGKL